MTTELATVSAPALMRPPTWEEALTPFLDLQNSLQTRRAYGAAVADAMVAMGIEHPAEITAPMLAAHRAALVARLDAKGERRLAPSSVSLKLAALRSYLKFCRLTGILQLTAEVIAYTLESPSAKVLKPYEILTPTEQRRVLDSLASRSRDRALVALALGAGLRAAELTAVRLGDLFTDDDGGQWVMVKQGKGRKDRAVPLAGDVAELLRAYLASAKLRRGDYLFSSRQGESGRLTTARIWQIVTSAVRAAGITKRLSPHSLRHTFALGRLKAGASPVIVQKMLGHASLTTTQKYLDHLDMADLRQWAAPLPADVSLR